MIPSILHALGLFALPTASLELADEIAVFSSAPVHSITTDGDTAYVCQGSTVTKMVRAKRLEVVDSLPSRNANGWDDAKYVHLGDGMGMVAVVDFPFPDTAVWLVDWKRSSRTSLGGTDSRWRAYATLPKGEGFTFTARLSGQANNRYKAVFGSDKGLFQFRYGTAQSGEAVLRLESSLGYDGSSNWESLSLAASALSWDRPLQFQALVGIRSSDALTNFWQAPPNGESMSLLAPVALPFPQGTADSASWSKASSVLASPDGTGWISLHDRSSVGWFCRKPSPTSPLEASAFPLPGLVSQFGREWNVPVVGARSSEGLDLLGTRTRYAALAGDSLLAVYAWNGDRTPNLVSVQEVRHPTRAIAFGDTTLWLADRGEIHSWRMKQGTARTLAREEHPAPRLSWSEGAWKIHGEVGALVDLVTPSGRLEGRVKIGSDGKASLPSSSTAILVRTGSSVLTVPTAR